MPSIAAERMTAEPIRQWSIEGRALRLGPWLHISVQRTTQTPAGDLPPRSYGALPLATAPGTEEVLVPVFEEEAIWLGFEPLDDDVAVAIRVEVMGDGGRDAVTGGAWLDELAKEPQNYVVCPPQRALDGITMSSGWARQFARVATTPGAAATARLRLVAFPGSRAFAGGSPETAPRFHGSRAGSRPALLDLGSDRGKDRRPGVGQIIAADPFELRNWHLEAAVAARLRLVSPDVFTATTGLPAPSVLDPRDVYDGRRLP